MAQNSTHERGVLWEDGSSWFVLKTFVLLGWGRFIEICGASIFFMEEVTK